MVSEPNSPSLPLEVSSALFLVKVLQIRRNNPSETKLLNVSFIKGFQGAMRGLLLFFCFIRTLISSFSTSRDIVVVYLQLFMEKQEASSLAPSFLCCADSVVRGMFVIRSKLLPNKRLN